MSGLAAAALLEATAGEGIVSHLAHSPALPAAGAGSLVALGLAAAFAFAARSSTSAPPLLEPVLTSLTAPARALASVALPPASATTEAASALDAAVDALLAKCVFAAADFAAPAGTLVTVGAAEATPPPGAVDAPGAALVAALGAVRLEEELEGADLDDFSDLDVW